MNRVCLIGAITKAVEIRKTKTDLSVANFTLAINRETKNKEGNYDADFISCVAWKKTAETVANHLDKGSQIGLEGRIQTGSYDDQNGNKRYTTEVVADSVTFLESKNQASNSSNNMASEPTPYDYQEQTTAPTNNVNIEDDPFADFGDTVSIDDNFLD